VTTDRRGFLGVLLGLVVLPLTRWMPAKRRHFSEPTVLTVPSSWNGDVRYIITDAQRSVWIEAVYDNGVPVPFRVEPARRRTKGAA
jgi:hypothetical protein